MCAKWIRLLSARARRDAEDMCPQAREQIKERFRELSELDCPQHASDVDKMHGVQYGQYRLKPSNGLGHKFRAFFDLETWERPDAKGRKGAIIVQTVRRRNEKTYR